LVPSLANCISLPIISGATTTRRNYPCYKNIKGLGKIISLLAAIFITLKSWEK
jgi:hypothetical protein